MIDAVPEVSEQEEVVVRPRRTPRRARPRPEVLEPVEPVAVVEESTPVVLVEPAAPLDLTPIVDLSELEPAAPKAARRLPPWLRASATTLVWTGVGLVAVGFAVLAFTWGKVAGLLLVPLQLPYLASGGAGGMALVIAGLVVLQIAVRRREDARRARSLQRLVDSLAEVRAALAERDRP